MGLLQTVHLKVREVKECRWDVPSRSRRTLIFFTIVLIFPFLYHASEWIAVTTTDFVKYCPEPDSSPSELCHDWGRQKRYTPSLLDVMQPEYNIPNAPVTSNRNFNLPALFEGDKYDKLVIVTACTASYYMRLKNLVGSIHFWEPGLKIIIYDIGLRRKQRQEILTWRGVELIEFDFEKHPPYVALVWNFSWKIFLIKEVMEKYPTLLWLDSGVELRHPLVGVRHFLEKDGFFGTTMEQRQHITGATTRQETFDLMTSYGLDKMDTFDVNEIMGSPFCSGYAMGFDRERSKSILDYAVKCASEEDCISPKGATPDDHNFDQSAFTISVHAHGLAYACEHENIVADTAQWNLPTIDEARCNFIELAARRWRSDRPYIKYIHKNEHARELSSEPIIEQLKPDFIKSEPKNYSHPEVVVVERRSRIGALRKSDEEYMECVNECKNSINDYNAHFQICVLKCKESTDEPLYEAYQSFITSMNIADRGYDIYFLKGKHCQTILKKTFFLTIILWLSTVIYLFTPHTLCSCMTRLCVCKRKGKRKHLHDS
jgi:hypothetical protein